MGEKPNASQINRKFEHNMIQLNNLCYDMQTGKIQDNTSKVLLGVIKDDFKNQKEIFIPIKDLGRNK